MQADSKKWKIIMKKKIKFTLLGLLGLALVTGTTIGLATSCSDNKKTEQKAKAKPKITPKKPTAAFEVTKQTATGSQDDLAASSTNTTNTTNVADNKVTTYKHNFSGEDSTSLPNIKLSYSYKTNNDQIANLVSVEQIKKAFDARLDGYKKQFAGVSFDLPHIDYSISLLDDEITVKSLVKQKGPTGLDVNGCVKTIKLTPNSDGKYTITTKIYDGENGTKSVSDDLTLEELIQYVMKPSN